MFIIEVIVGGVVLECITIKGVSNILSLMYGHWEDKIFQTNTYTLIPLTVSTKTEHDYLCKGIIYGRAVLLDHIRLYLMKWPVGV